MPAIHERRAWRGDLSSGNCAYKRAKWQAKSCPATYSGEVRAFFRDPTATRSYQPGRTLRDTTLADITLGVFMLCNSLRVVAYVPQITKAARDQSGAEAISFLTWGLFLFSNASAIAYAVVNNEDWMMACVFLGNAAGCAAILLIGAWKRTQHRSQRVGKVAMT